MQNKAKEKSKQDSRGEGGLVHISEILPEVLDEIIASWFTPERVVLTFEPSPDCLCADCTAAYAAALT